MFSVKTDASKVALVHLAARLKKGGFLLLDAQFPNPHLEQFGAVEISERQFDRLLANAVTSRADFYSFDGSVSMSGSPSGPSSSSAKGSSSESSSVATGGGASVMQVMTHTS